MTKAVFLDRDGTIIYEKPGVYLSHPQQVRLYKSTRPALKLLSQSGFKLFIVSNQSGIGRGYFTEEEVNAVHVHLLKLLKPARIEEIVFCPHAPDEKCSCRKPQPKMALDLIKKYPDLHPDKVATNLLNAAKFILTDSEETK